FLEDPNVRAIWLARGGYGAARILDRVDWSALSRDPKPLLGYSDATALFARALRARSDLPARAARRRDRGPEGVPRAVPAAPAPGRGGRSRGTSRSGALERTRGRTARRGEPHGARAPSRHGGLPGFRRRHPLPRGERRGGVPGRPAAPAPPGVADA